MSLAAHDARGVGMNLHGHADHLTAEGHGDAAGIAAAAADLIDMADDLHDLALDVAAPRILRMAPLLLGPVVDEAVAAVSAAILPGQRNWRILPDLRPVELVADPRALRHALTRVLADAVRSTRHDDWIDITGHAREASYVLAVADEGRGGLTPGVVPRGADSRGIGLRLALARALVEAHGGRMEVESLTGVGSRVSLVFPRPEGGPASRPSRSYAASLPAGGCDGR
jgi:signal transduction histidine kinase